MLKSPKMDDLWPKHFKNWSNCSICSWNWKTPNESVRYAESLSFEYIIEHCDNLGLITGVLRLFVVIWYFGDVLIQRVDGILN